MRFTNHGMGHAHDRTSMNAGDLRELIEEKVYIKLGEEDGTRFFLFWSAPDDDAKIALVRGRTTPLLISVWKKDFNLPKGVKRPDARLCRRAKAAYRSYLKTYKRKSFKRRKT